MMTASASPYLPLSKSFSIAASIAVFLVGCVVLAGWTANIAILKSFFPGMVVMKANTALAFSLAGISLWLFNSSSPQTDRYTRYVRQVTAMLVFLLGSLTFAEYMMGLDLGIDELVFQEMPGAPETFTPGRMAPVTAFNFSLIGASLLFMSLRTEDCHRLGQWLVLPSIFTSWLAVLGFLFGVEPLYDITPIMSLASIAPNTSLTFILLCTAMLFTQPDLGPIAIMVSDGSGGLMARRLSLAAIVVPVILGWLTLMGQRAGLYNANMSFSLFIIANTIIFFVLVVSNASALNRSDIVRRQVASELLQRTDQLEATNKRLQSHASALEAANKELESISYTVSHDLRSPLRAVDGFSRILLEDYSAELAQDAKRYLQLVRGNAQQMGRLIDDLLEFLQLGRYVLNRQKIMPIDIVNRAIEELQEEQKDRKIEIVIGDLPACDADPGMLKQVFVNLISNALKFTRKKELPRIEIGSQLTKGNVVYFVKDNGAGFDMQYANKLFGVFQRLHSSEEYEGNGMGLANVQRIIHRHGGRIWAEGEVGKGATFYFTLQGGVLK